MSVLTITLGNTDELQLKVPEKGETNWADTFRIEFAQKIVEHDHTGVDGKGAKISEAALEDNAVTTAKLADSSVTTAKLVDLNVTTAKLADNSVTNAKMGSDIPLATLSNVSSNAPTAGQVLKWSGTEWAPGTDAAAAAGTVVIANQTDATAYSPTEGDVVTINSTDTTINFSQNFSNIILKVSSATELHFRGNVTNCNISTVDDLNFENLSTDGTTTTEIVGNTLKCGEYDASSIRFGGSSTAGNTIKVANNNMTGGNIVFNSTAIIPSNTITKNIINAANGMTSSLSSDLILDDCHITTSKVIGLWDVVNDSTLKVGATGLTTLVGAPSNSSQVKCGGSTYIISPYFFPFTADSKGVNTNVVVNVYKDGEQTISSTSATKVELDTVVFDNTSAFNTSTNTFTAKVAGYYRVTANVYLKDVNETQVQWARIYRNKGTVDAQNVTVWMSMTTNHSTTFPNDERYGVAVGTFLLDIGDEIILEVDSNNDSSYVVNSNVFDDETKLMIEKIN